LSATSIPSPPADPQSLSLSCLRRADVLMRRHSIPLSPALFTRSAEWPLEGLVSPQFLSPVFLLTDHCPPTCPDPVRVAAHSCFKSFTCNTYGSPRKCCKQKTYGTAKPFRCNTYRKPGVGVPRLSTFRRADVPACRRGSDLSPLFSPSYSLTYTTDAAQSFWNQSVTHTFHRDGGCISPRHASILTWSGRSTSDWRLPCPYKGRKMVRSRPGPRDARGGRDKFPRRYMQDHRSYMAGGTSAGG